MYIPDSVGAEVSEDTKVLVVCEVLLEGTIKSRSDSHSQQLIRWTDVVQSSEVDFFDSRGSNLLLQMWCAGTPASSCCSCAWSRW